jgi:hypothetical protein
MTQRISNNEILRLIEQWDQLKPTLRHSPGQSSPDIPAKIRFIKRAESESSAAALALMAANPGAVAPVKMVRFNPVTADLLKTIGTRLSVAAQEREIDTTGIVAVASDPVAAGPKDWHAADLTIGKLRIICAETCSSLDELKSIAGIGVAHANVFESHLETGQPGTQPPNAMPPLPPELHSLYDRIGNSTAAKEEVDLFVAFSFENHTLAGQSWGDPALQAFLIEWMKTLTLEPSAASIRRAEIRKQILARYPPTRIPFEQVRAHLDENRRLIEGAQYDGCSSYLFKIVLECHRMIRIGDPPDLPTLPDKIELTRAEALVKIEEYRTYCARRIAEFDKSERQPAEDAKKAVRAKLTKDEANIKARAFLRHNPKATARQLATGIGCALGMVSNLPAWQAVKEERDKGRQPKKSGTVALTPKMEKLVGSEDDALAKLIDEQKADAEPSPLEHDPPTERLGAPRQVKIYRR